MSVMETVAHNRSVIKRAKAGDLLEFPRGFYSHWAVYIGNEEVVHLAGTENDGINGNFNSGHVFTICGKSFNKAQVKKEDIWNVICGSKIKINNDKDKKCDPRPAHEIVEEALMKLGEIGYNVLWENCEHFAAYCRYGVAWSKQANNFLTAAVGVGTVVMVGALLKEMFWGNGEKKQET
ncbi:phospholipase A and acyltransferase 3-like [Ostrea edulis]|uniref:phospholipase A and acyltransferase 3-like n=1 Tax=Ostrea edulis TaxID=37623 RepID=UPI0024AEF405|nr:phospholipase A and acyltransferase 3-like [Ostrea edulis]XP_056012809.1 phospholipase A and acyltransferase 3-like [Ostrea edulis]XP_056012810.1 phospholipase A and acyltransferase 3-like [Ostrea edulis]XP_056012811.1 phospholipase A and acyltransferase 3-like [Ostrea edulis]